MNRDLARSILDLQELIEAFREPAERLWQKQDERQGELDALCLLALREMVLDAARKEWALFP